MERSAARTLTPKKIADLTIEHVQHAGLDLLASQTDQQCITELACWGGGHEGEKAQAETSINSP